MVLEGLVSANPDKVGDVSRSPMLKRRPRRFAWQIGVGCQHVPSRPEQAQSVAMRTSSGVNYDAIAHLYDSQPYRGKTVDPELVAFTVQRASSDRLSILDIACGTGSQLVANRSVVSEARLVGLDRSFGMLRQAQHKTLDIAWVQADGSMLPFRSGSFDFITCQFGFHHLRDKAGMLHSVFNVLRFDGSTSISFRENSLTG
jgi:ubiquinone/menaquinone biosynthesis C-methylase UbiE